MGLSHSTMSFHFHLSPETVKDRFTVRRTDSQIAQQLDFHLRSFVDIPSSFGILQNIPGKLLIWFRIERYFATMALDKVRKPS
jgi:hypothetical protein